MRLATYRYEGEESVGVLSADAMTVYPLKEAGILCKDMNEAVAMLKKAELEKLRQMSLSGGNKGIPYASVEKCAPIPRPRQDVLCLGINYMAHAEESARYKKEAFERDRDYPVYFSKRVNEAVPDGGFIESHSNILERLDYEVELAVIIGKDAKNVVREDAWEYVFGYTILNDISAREIQTRHKQWYFGKSMDGFCPMGPWIVTKDEFPNPPSLRITSRVNGELRQDSTTDLLVFDIPYVVEELSKGMTLQAGTIISMGTPAGVGMGFDPPRFLVPGDVVECEIEGIGKLRNTVK